MDAALQLLVEKADRAHNAQQAFFQTEANRLRTLMTQKEDESRASLPSRWNPRQRNEAEKKARTALKEAAALSRQIEVFEGLASRSAKSWPGRRQRLSLALAEWRPWQLETGRTTGANLHHAVFQAWAPPELNEWIDSTAARFNVKPEEVRKGVVESLRRAQFEAWKVLTERTGTAFRRMPLLIAAGTNAEVVPLQHALNLANSSDPKERTRGNEALLDPERALAILPEKERQKVARMAERENRLYLAKMEFDRFSAQSGRLAALTQRYIRVKGKKMDEKIQGLKGNLDATEGMVRTVKTLKRDFPNMPALREATEPITSALGQLQNQRDELVQNRAGLLERIRGEGRKPNGEEQETLDSARALISSIEEAQTRLRELNGRITDETFNAAIEIAIGSKATDVLALEGGIQEKRRELTRVQHEAAQTVEELVPIPRAEHLGRMRAMRKKNRRLRLTFASSLQDAICVKARVLTGQLDDIVGNPGEGDENGMLFKAIAQEMALAMHPDRSALDNEMEQASADTQAGRRRRAAIELKYVRQTRPAIESRLAKRQDEIFEPLRRRLNMPADPGRA